MLTSVSWDSGETMLYHSEQNMLPHTEQSCSKRGAKVHLDGTEWLERGTKGDRISSDSS